MNNNGEEGKEGKREWKQEKKAADDNVAESEDTSNKNLENGTQYDGIAAEFLECHICEKKMWDGRSFENHIKGRAHHIMMDKTRESYKMTADAMRQELKIGEMRSNRGPVIRKAVCAMCDLFVANGSTHRRSPGHQKLKKYLHPSCNACRKEMPTRIELDEHRLTPQHMRVLQEVNIKPKVDVMVITTMQYELSQLRTLRPKSKEVPAAPATEPAEGESPVVEVGAEGIEENKEEPVAGPVVLLEYEEGMDLSEYTKANLPRYDPDRALATGFITDFSSKQCILCKKLFDSEETAEVHTRTLKHFHCFLRLLNSKGNFKNKQLVNLKREAPEDEKDEEGDLKRQKIDHGEENGDAMEELSENQLLGDADVEQTTNGIKDLSVNTTEALDADITVNLENSLNDVDVSLDAPALEVVPEPVPAPSPMVSPMVNKTPQRGRGRGRTPRGRRGGYNRI